VIEYLGKTKDPTGRSIDKEHEGFKDLYNAIYRGVGFALVRLGIFVPSI